MAHSIDVTTPDIFLNALLDRDLSILAFNERVLDWAHRPEVPVLERLRYLCIVSSNLDEFFEVRAEPHVMGSLQGLKSGPYTEASLSALADKTSAMIARQYALYNDELLPSLQRKGYRILSHNERNATQRQWVRSYFQREVQPLLVPVGLDPAHPFPQVANKSLNFIVQLSGKDAFGRSNEIAIVKVPRVLPRLIPLPAKVCDGTTAFVLLSSVIRAHLDELFPGREVGHFSQFRVTRHSELAVHEDEIANLRMALRQGLQHRNYGQAVRLEVSANCAPKLSEFLRKEFQLPQASVFRVNGPVNLVRLMQLIDLVAAPELLFPPYKASFPAQIPQNGSIFTRLKAGDAIVFGWYGARVLSFIGAATATWLINRRWTFAIDPEPPSVTVAPSSTRTQLVHEYLKYLSCMLFGGLLNYGTYVAVMDYANSAAILYAPLIGLAAGSLVGLFANFLVARFLIFKPTR